MYFGNYGFQKTLLDKCLKGRVLEDLPQATRQMGSNSAEM